MKVSIIDTQNRKTGEIELPQQFGEEVRLDLIKRAVVTLQSNDRQPYGAAPRAGKRYSAKLSRRRRAYRGSYGAGISRVPRKILSRRGRRMHWVGALAPGTVGGRRAHPPKAGKIIIKKINIKENRKAIRSCIAATMQKSIVQERGHQIPTGFPFILSSSFEAITKTKDMVKALESVGLEKELARTEERKIRAGKGKARNRKYKSKKGPLIVLSKDSAISKSAKNIPGIDIVTVNQLNAALLAPGAVPGRLTLWTQNAIEVLQKDNLFM